MADGGHKDEYTYPESDDDMEWWAETRMNIRDIRSLYSSINFYQTIWPGEPDSPKSEKIFMENYKANLFRMIADYKQTQHKIDEVDTPTTDDT